MPSNSRDCFTFCGNLHLQCVNKSFISLRLLTLLEQVMLTNGLRKLRTGLWWNFFMMASLQLQKN